MNNKEKAELKRRMKLSFTNVISHDVSVLNTQIEGLVTIATKHQTRARYAKLLIFFAGISKKLCDSKQLAIYPISHLKKCFFATGSYDFITGVVDEAEAIEHTILLAIASVTDYMNKEDLL
jgi:hypothetical protein